MDQIQICFIILASIFQMSNRISDTFTSQTEVKSELPGKNKQLLQSLRDFLSFERTCFSLTSSYIELPTFLVVFHTFFAYLLLSEHDFSPFAHKIVATMRDSPTLYLLLQILIYSLNLMMIIVLLGCNLKYKNHIWFSAVKRILSLYSFLARGLVFLTAMLCYIDLEENLFALFMAITVSIFNELLLGNYCLKKDENYQSSHQMSFILRVGIIGNFISNCFLVRFGHLRVFCFCSAMLGGITLLWHHLGGYQLFFHKISRIINLIFCSSLVSSSLIYFLLACSVGKGVSFNPLQFGISFAVVLFYLYHYENKKRFSFIDAGTIIEKEKSLKDYELNMNILLEQSDESKSDKTLLIGIFVGSQKVCKNPNCWSKKINYDAQNRQELTGSQMMNEKESFLSFYFQCIYSQAIDYKRSKDNLLAYVQFAISDIKDFSRHCLMLQELEEMDNLSFFDKIKIYKLKLILKEQSQAFNRLVHGGKIELDELVQSQRIYAQIMDNIELYCKLNTEIWTSCMSREVSMQQIQQDISKSLDLIPTLTADWHKLNKFVNLKRQWKYAYLSFVLFLKNEKIKNKDNNFSGKTRRITNFAENGELVPLNQEGTRKHQYFNESFIFQEDFTVIMSSLEGQRLKIVKTNKDFQKITGYSEEKVRGSDLCLLYPEEIKSSHDLKVVNWMNSGHTIDENSYCIKNTHFLNNFNEQVQALVFFKLYIDLLHSESLLKFVCLIKRVDKEKKLDIKTNGSFVNGNESFALSNNSSVVLLEPGKKGEMSEHKRSRLSLDPVCNIFLKDDNLQPVVNLLQLKRIRQVTLLLTIILIIVFLFLSLNIKKNTDQITEEANSEIIVINLYNLPFILGKYYYSQVLMPGPYLMPKIAEVTQSLKHYSQNPLVKKLMFNTDINLPAKYLPYQTNSVNEGIEMSNTDVYYLIQSCLTTLQTQMTRRDAHDFVMFNSYIKPGYDSVMNTTKHQLHLKMNGNLQILWRYQIISMISISLALILAVVYLCVKIYNYLVNMRQVMETIVEFSNHEIEGIVSYWQSVGSHFSWMKEREREMVDNVIELSLRNCSEGKSQFKQEIAHQATLNQKHKVLVVSSSEKTKSYKICVLMIVLMLGYICGIIGIHVPNLKKISDLQEFQEEGYSLIKHFPTTGVIGYAIGNRFTTEYQPAGDSFNLQRFKDSLSTLRLILDDDSKLKGIKEGSLFSQKARKYLFSNPCTYNPEVLTEVKYTIDTCSELGNKSFSNGIIAYLRFTEPLINNYLKGIETISEAELYDLSIGYSLAGYYFTDALVTWHDEFSGGIASFYDFNLLLSVLVCLLLVFLYLFIFQMMVLSSLKRDYRFVSAFFRMGVPEHVLTEQKVIKQKFIQSGIISSN